MEIRFIKKINENPVVVDSFILIFCYCLSIFIVNPIGNFPLNDDWSFATTVKRYIELGIYLPTGWTAMSLLTNILWGLLFCLPAGFSFNALRASTLTASLAGVFGVYFCAKELGLARPYRIIAALTLAFNPIYYALSNTFMTDVLFSSLQAISALFFVRCIKRDSILSLAIGAGVALAATMSRQLGVAIPLAFAVAYIFLHGVNWRSLCRGLLPLLVCVGALVWYQHWLLVTGRMTPLYSAQNERVFAAFLHPRALMLTEAGNAYVALLYFGLFLMPVLVSIVPIIWQQHAQKNINIWLVAMLAGLAIYFFSHYFGEPRLPVPKPGNILMNFGIGPMTLKDTYILGAYVPELPLVFWSTLTWLAMFCGGLMLSAFMLFISRLVTDIRQRKLTRENSVVLFLLLSTFIYLLAIFISEYFDRYFIPVLALLMLGILGLFPKQKIESGLAFRYAGIVLTLAFAGFSICTTKDYLAWNRARWQALNELTLVQKIDSQEIDGGFEFNGFYLYDRNYRLRPNKSWWWVTDDTYLIGFQGSLGYTTIKDYPYSHWLPPYVGHILVQKKAAF